MRKLLVTLFGLAMSTAAFGQGEVRFSNVSLDLSSPPDRLVRLGPSLSPFHTNTPLVNFGASSWRAQLYYGASTASESSLIPVTAAPALFRASTTTTEPGTWVPGNRSFTGFDTGATVNFQVRVWDSQFGSTWELACAYPGNFCEGKSAIFRYTIPNPDVLVPPSAYAMSQFVGFIIDVPEPGSLALTLLGLGNLVLFRRHGNQH